MIFTIVDAVFRLGYGQHRVFLLFLLILLCPLGVSADWLTVDMEGGRENIHIDTDKGALYVGMDCTPLLYFSEAPQRRSKSLKSTEKYYNVEQRRSRRVNKSALPSRIPTAIIIDGSSVQVVSESLHGRARAQGKVRAAVLAGKKKAIQCK